MEGFKELFFTVLKEGLMLEFKSDEGKINWKTAFGASLLTMVYIFCQTQIAGYYAQYLHKEYPLIRFEIVFIPTAIIAFLCLLLMFLMAYNRIKFDKKLNEKNRKK